MSVSVFPGRRIVHLQTRVQVVFAELDDDGNVGPGLPVNLEISKFSRATFGEAYEAAVAERAKLTSAPREAE